MTVPEETKKDPTEESKVAIPVSGEKNDKDDKNKPEELSEEDQELKEGLELAVVRLQEDDDSLHKPALDHLVNEIKSSTSSMTSVPKPLKFLRPHYESLKTVYESWPITHSMKKMMADVMSVLAMTMATPGSREMLKFKLQGTNVNISAWGHEYVRSLSGEISEEYNQRLMDADTDEDAFIDDLMALVDDILPFQMKHNAEAEAVDLLLEVRQLTKLVDTPVVDERNYSRVCLYLIRSAAFIEDPEEVEKLFDTTFKIYKNQKKFTDALRIAMRMSDDQKISELLTSSESSEMEKIQMALVLAGDRSWFSLPENEKLNEIIGNNKLSEQYLTVGRDMDILAPKAPEDIYKTYLAEGVQPLRTRNQNNQNTNFDAAKMNLASSIVNGFVNAGFNKDKLLFDTEAGAGTAAGAGNSWIYKNKGNGIISAVASMGMLMMWNVEEGLNQIDKYFNNNDEFIKAGACLGIGIMSNGVRNESDPAMALLSECLDSKLPSVRLASISGLGLAYCGSRKAELKELLEGTIANTEGNIAESAMAALSLGMIFVGTCDDDIGTVILTRLMETSEVDHNQSISRFLSLGLGLLYLGRGERVDVVLEALRTIEHARAKYAEITVSTCAFAGSGNVLKVQEMLRLCTDHLTEGPVSEQQALAVVGIALIAFGEEIGTEMTLRSFEHLLHYGELPVRRAVPLALSLLYLSNPEYNIVDQLSRLSHDQDPEVSQAAILGLGLVSAGSNNSRVANLLRQLAEFYARESNHLFMVKIAQGMNAMGKGLLSLSPFHSDR
jgi:26S proteasome regulatory subunit N1